MSSYDGVLVVGESLIDVVRAAGGEQRHPGGSPMNVAFGLCRLGVPTRLLTRIGRDADGHAIAAHLQAAGVEILADSYTDSATSTAIATVGGGGAASYEFEIDWRLTVPAAFEPPRWVHVGSISTFLIPGADSVEQLLVTLAGTAVVSYDPNIREALVGDREGARARFERICRLADVVKLSDEDAGWLYPDAADDPHGVIASVLALGPRVVALTLGAGGSLIATAAHSAQVPVARVEVVDTIGAGDSFMAALVAQLIDRDLDDLTADQLRRVGDFASRAAGITCGRAGANPPTLREMQAQR